MNQIPAVHLFDARIYGAQVHYWVDLEMCRNRSEMSDIHQTTPELYATVMHCPPSCIADCSASAQPHLSLAHYFHPLVHSSHYHIVHTIVLDFQIHISTMAEIFGAVASGAGLVSLSMQLLDSAQKLKGFCDLCRDAPETVKQLYSDLETMALALRQFEQYRQNDVFGSELLSRCIVACDQAVARIKTAIDKVDRLLSRARFAGRIYMGFKEPEVRKLLEDMERAKSSMLLAYTSYCQYVSSQSLDLVANPRRRLWNMQQTANHAAALSLQSRQLERLQASVQSGNLALFGHITTFASQQIASCDEPAQRTVSKQHISPTRLARKRVKQGIDYTFRLRLPRRLVDCVWEFGVHECDNVWTFQLKPINIRPAHTFVFDFVRAGDTDAVRELLRSGQLSVHDRQASKNGNKTLLEVSGAHQYPCLRAVLLTSDR
jgi:hypothetical protein